MGSGSSMVAVHALRVALGRFNRPSGTRSNKCRFFFGIHSLVGMLLADAQHAVVSMLPG